MIGSWAAMGPAARGEPLPDGWDAIPDTWGCTPQSCAFRDHHRELAGLGPAVYGLSTQTIQHQARSATAESMRESTRPGVLGCAVIGIGAGMLASVLVRVPPAALTRHSFEEHHRAQRRRLSEESWMSGSIRMRPEGCPCINAGPEALKKSESATGQKREELKMKSRNIPVITIAALLAALGGMALAAQDKYALKTPSGVAFSDFRGYEGWQLVSVARTDEVLKVIVANPTMIDAYRAGVPGNGKPFPDGSKIAKLQWNPKKSTEAPFVVDVPDTFAQAFFIEKDSKRFPNSAGWGYALFNYDAASDTFTADPSPSDCGHACHVAVKAKDHIFHPYQKR
jgi:hypothetical protein